MPPKRDQIHLMVKTHRYTLALTVTPLQSMRDLKVLVVRALSQFADTDPAAGFDLSPSVDDFEVAKRNDDGSYDLLDEDTKAMDLRLPAWTRLYLRWRDERGHLQPVNVDRPSFYGEEEDDPMEPAPAVVAAPQPSSQSQKSTPAKKATGSKSAATSKNTKRKRVAETDDDDDYMPDDDP